MSSDILNRSAVRKALAALLATALVGSGLPVQAVYAYQKGNFDDMSPVVCVVSGSSDRTKLTNVAVAVSAFTIELHTFVLYASDDDSWTEENSEDRIDLIEKEITDVLIDNYNNAGVWDAIVVEEPSAIMPIKIGNASYRHEVIFCTIEAYDD